MNEADKENIMERLITLEVEQKVQDRRLDHILDLLEKNTAENAEWRKLIGDKVDGVAMLIQRFQHMFYGVSATLAIFYMIGIDSIKLFFAT